MGVEQRDSKSYKAGDPFPEPKKGVLRAYLMRFCPFCQRTLMSLVKKGIDFEIINIDTVNKPQWFLDRAPLGKVPVLEYEGFVCFDSGICNEWIESKFANPEFMPANPEERAKQKMMLERLQPIFPAYYTLIHERNKAKIKALSDGFDLCENLLTDKFYGGGKAGFADFLIWPVFERSAALPLFGSGKVEFLNDQKHPKLSEWYKRMQNEDLVKKTMHSPEIQAKFFEGYKIGKPDFDFKM